MLTDPISDYLTILRNAIKAKHLIVSIPQSNIKKEITKVLYSKGYIKNYKFENKSKTNGVIKVVLKYSKENQDSAIVSIKRVSRPGLRKYVKRKNVPKVLNGLGILILSTSKGIITDKEARVMNIGGEILCYVY